MHHPTPANEPSVIEAWLPRADFFMAEKSTSSFGGLPALLPSDTLCTLLLVLVPLDLVPKVDQKYRLALQSTSCGSAIRVSAP